MPCSTGVVRRPPAPNGSAGPRSCSSISIPSGALTKAGISSWHCRTASALPAATLPAHTFYLIGSSGYGGAVAADYKHGSSWGLNADAGTLQLAQPTSLATLPIHKDRALQFRQEAENGPVPHFRFRDEADGHDAGKHDDVQP